MRDCPDLQKMCQRVREKSASYEQYNFTCYFDDFLKAFFDLAQEYTTLENLYLVCTLVPKEFFDLNVRLYLLGEDGISLSLVCSSNNGLEKDSSTGNPEVVVQENPYFTGESYVIPIRGNKALGELLPFQYLKDILGMFEISPGEKVTEQ